jgi:1,4-dihydroxy-2-naphthoate octaprenyltransferase
MDNKKVILSEKEARMLFHDVLLSNLLFIVIALSLLFTSSSLLVQCIIGFYIIVVALHIRQSKKLLIKGKLLNFKKKVKKSDRSNGPGQNSGSE